MLIFCKFIRRGAICCLLTKAYEEEVQTAVAKYDDLKKSDNAKRTQHPLQRPQKKCSCTKCVATARCTEKAPYGINLGLLYMFL